MGFSLIADRFVPLAHALHLDVATGDHAWLRIEPATEDADGLRWAERCATLITLWHPSLAECVDFGLLPTGQRFEAYRVNQLLPRRAGRVFDASRVRDRVDEFLFACGVLPGAPSIEGADASGRWLAVPARRRCRSRSAGHGRESGGRVHARRRHRHVSRAPAPARRQRRCASRPSCNLRRPARTTLCRAADGHQRHRCRGGAGRRRPHAAAGTAPARRGAWAGWLWRHLRSGGSKRVAPVMAPRSGTTSSAAGT